MKEDSSSTENEFDLVKHRLKTLPSRTEWTLSGVIENAARRSVPAISSADGINAALRSYASPSDHGMANNCRKMRLSSQTGRRVQRYNDGCRLAHE